MKHHQKGKVMNLIEKSLSAFITETFGTETMDIVSEACEKLSYFDTSNLDSDTPQLALFIFENFRTLIRVSEAVDEAADTHDLEYDFDFDAISPWAMLDERYYCVEDNQHYYVSKNIKMLIGMGQGVSWMIKSREAFYKGMLSERQIINAAK